MTQRYITLSFSCVLLLFACKPENRTRSSRTGYILGPSSDIEIFSQSRKSKPDIITPTWDINAVAASIPIVVTTHTDENDKKTRAQFCSASLIVDPRTQKTLVLTNFHCLADQTQDPNDSTKTVYSTELSKDACVQTRFAFGHTEEGEVSKVIRCREGSARGTSEGDIAVFEPAEELGDEYLRLEISSNKEAENSANIVIHYPDTEGHRKLAKGVGADLPVQSITAVDCNLTTRFSSDQWDLDPTLFASIRSTCDIEHGSSGSVLLDLKTGKINGLNWGGIEIQYENRVETYNAATSPDYLLAFLEGRENEYTTSGKSSDAIAQTTTKASNSTEKLNKMQQKPKSCGVVSR